MLISRMRERCRVLDERQAHRKGAASADVALDRDLPVQSLDDGLADAQAKPVARPLFLTRPRLIRAIEPLEDPRQYFPIDADARVLDYQQHLLPGRIDAQMDDDLAGVAVVLDGVVDQVAD